MTAAQRTHELLSLNDVAQQLKMNRNKATSYIHTGELKAIRFTERGVYRFRQSDVDAFIAAHVVAPPQEEEQAHE